MAESQALEKKASAREERKRSAAEEAALAAAQERALGRNVAIGLPAGTVLIALGVGFAFGIGPAILVLAGGALLGAIVLFWASLRTLGGDAPLPTALEELGSARRHDDLSEKKERVLRSLKDLENERAVGKLEEDDYLEVSARYRDEAKAILRQQDDEVAPYRKRAEEIAAAYLKKRGLGVAKADATEEKADADGKVASTEEPAATSAPKAMAKPTCPSCGTANDVDATFCKKCATRLTQEEADEEVSDATG